MSSARATRQSSRLQQQSSRTNTPNRSSGRNARKPESKYMFNDSDDEVLPPGTPQKPKSKIDETTPKKEHRVVVSAAATSGRTTRRAERKYIFSHSDDDDARPLPCSPQKSKREVVTHITPKKECRSSRRPAEITPKKQQNKAIPVTPSNKSEIVHNPVTPSTLLKRLSLVTPTKRKYSSKLTDGSEDEGHKVSPSKQRKDGNDENALSPKKSNDKNAAVSPQKSSSGVYQNARRALHSTFPVEMPGREAELESLRDFIHGHLNNDTSGSLYVSGPPGTGKTACLNLVLQEKDIAAKVIHVYVNCTSIKSSGSVYSRIAKDLKVDLQGSKTEKDFESAITRYLDRKHKTILLVLDEIDQLESKKQSILYTIFEWPAKKNSKLILIGIANALDLTDRILPRLQSRCELKPKLMHFSPYTKQQIVDILTSRLKNAGVLDVFSPVALQMLAAKVSAVSGDLRRALDIGRRVVELADVNDKDHPLKPLENLTEELLLDQKSFKSVDVKQVVTTLNSVYGASHNFAEDMDEALPLQQKIVLCSLILILKRARNTDVTVGRLHEVYRKVCNKRNLQVVDQGEFMGMCSLIETKGIIKMIRKKDPRMSKVGLEWNEDEIAAVLNDKQLMSTIVQDVSCLGKL